AAFLCNAAARFIIVSSPLTCLSRLISSGALTKQVISNTGSSAFDSHQSLPFNIMFTTQSGLRM
ncbi:hypothetical protein P3737_25060, partial [Vibrio parahaemolyticus]|nr:hypothetical protein [Vibrio parahaemolyticus]